MARSKPTSIAGVIDQMTTIVQSGLKAIAAGGKELDQSLLDRVENQQQTMKSIHHTTQDNQRDWRKLASERTEAAVTLERDVRFFWRNLEHLNTRGMVDGQILIDFQVPTLKPNSGNRETWKTHAEHIIRTAEASDDVSAMVGLDAVSSSLTTLRQLESDTHEAKKILRLNQLARRQEKIQSLHLIGIVGRRIEEAHFGQPKSVIREILRTFGFLFKNDQTVEDIDDPTTGLNDNIEPTAATAVVAGGAN